MNLKLCFFVLAVVLTACSKDEYYSPDIGDSNLLPDRGDYLDEDYGTQRYAHEISGVYDSQIGLIYYDAETRTIPQLYLTRGQQDIHIDSLGSGAVQVSFERFNTSFMPLEMSIRIKSLLEVTADTIYLRGTDGLVRTADPDGEIGTPLPESDDAELVGKYVRATSELELFIDPMLPVPMKANIEGSKR
ncbi:hypothetical protein H8B06_00925 [Sphingobacterium sp. DN00404]|uniref:Uncharacterized protein n=1 Tax=Sphingobacterium micropteri TaxID=2763501 RepID=A0ABR7YJ72_9SPHI|nr:hypothetical protein [Sphingobacterium micropteri]MBD1431373.1 hypothetical protein [Sphingobacterium micropteri]